MDDNNDFDISRREVLLRRIGHELLLQSGDSTSRILPVKKIAENEYQIRFEHELTFQPDSLVNTTRRLLAKAPLERLSCKSAEQRYLQCGLWLCDILNYLLLLSKFYQW